MKVTRIAQSWHLNAGKYASLEEQARRLGRVRSRVWQEYGSVSGVAWSDFDICNKWMRDGTAQTFDTLANPWKQTVRDAVGDIRAQQASAKVKVKRAIARLPVPDTEKKRLFIALKGDWSTDPYLRRQMRKHCPRGKNRTHNQIIVRSDNYTTRIVGKTCWLSVPGLRKGETVRIPLKTTVEPTGTLRLLLRGGAVEVHYCIPAVSTRPHGDQRIGIDKGYTEVFADSDGAMHGQGFGRLLADESDARKIKNQRRNRLRDVARKAEARGDHRKAARIERNNLGTVKRSRREARFKAKARTIIYTATHAVVDKAAVIVSEDLTWVGSSRVGSKTMNRRMSAWLKGEIATAVENVTMRRGSAHALVNAAYTSQVDPRNGTLARRSGDQLHCFDGVVLQVDQAAARNILARMDDPEITRFMPHAQVKSIIAERTRQHRSRLPDQDARRRKAPASELSEAHAQV